jgi:hypothetical protein
MSFFSCGTKEEVLNEHAFKEIIATIPGMEKLTFSQFCHLSNDDVGKLYEEANVSIVQKAELEEIRYSYIQKKYGSGTST